jgi:hypothetical protein
MGRLASLIVAGFVLMATIAPASAQAPPPANTTTEFDGLWQVTQVCDAKGGSQGFTRHFAMSIKNGFARGQYGVEGSPNSGSVSGQLTADGTVNFVVNAQLGDPKYTTSGTAAGTPFGYTFPAQFNGKKGLGHRGAPTPCTFTFVRQ